MGTLAYLKLAGIRWRPNLYQPIIHYQSNEVKTCDLALFTQQMVDVKPALTYHPFEIPVTELIAEVPTNAAGGSDRYRIGAV